MWSRVRRAAGAGLLAVALAGCGAGPDSLTTETRPSIPGLNVSDSGVALRSVAVPFAPEGYPTGGTMPVTMVVFNDTQAPVALDAATSPVATTATLDGGAVLVPPAGYAHTTVTLTGLREDVQAVDIVPLELTFDNGASFQLEVPMAPPEQRVGERPQVVEPEEH